MNKAASHEYTNHEEKKQINNKNKILINRILEINKGKYKSAIPKPIQFENDIINRSKSLVSNYKKMEHNRIEQENNKLANRILYIQSSLNKEKMCNDVQKLEKCRKFFKRPSIDNDYMNEFPLPTATKPTKKKKGSKTKHNQMPMEKLPLFYSGPRKKRPKTKMSSSIHLKSIQDRTCRTVDNRLFDSIYEEDDYTHSVRIRIQSGLFQGEFVKSRLLYDNRTMNANLIISDNDNDLYFNIKRAEDKQAKLDFKGPCPVIERQDIKLELAVCKNSMAKEIRTQDDEILIIPFDCFPEKIETQAIQLEDDRFVQLDIEITRFNNDS